MSNVINQNELRSELSDSLVKYLIFMDKEREEVRRQKLASRYAARNSQVFADLTMGDTVPDSLSQRLTTFAEAARFGRVKAEKKSPLRSRLPFPMALQSYLRA